jgi:3-hydroxybutyryl-CoA dehydrogenase
MRELKDIRKVAVIGAGLMGHGIAQIFALRGYSVALMDMNKDIISKALDDVRANLTLMAKEGICTDEEIEPAVHRIATTTDIGEAVSDAQFVIEAVSENLALKQKIFCSMDELCAPDVILATNTSVISITEIASKSLYRERTLGTHFWNPPYLIPLVEVIRGEDTAQWAMDVTYDLLQKVGKHPVKVNKDVPGFVGNRLQHALWREAISIVDHGIADPKTVDECVKYGFGLRLPILGPLENMDMVGTDLTFAIHDYILKHLERSPEPSPLLRSLTEQGKLGFKTGHGFQQWSPEEIEASRNRLKAYLLHVMKG